MVNVINLINDLLEKAISMKASDIHLRDVNGTCKIEFRINGILQPIQDLKNPSELISRIKVMAKMNVAEKRLPQDGNISYGGKDLRVCVMPTITGESIVIRILNSYLEDISLKSLGYLEGNIQKIKKALNKKHGLILVTGPTGSGKSTTLLSLTKMLDDGKKKIISIEDPVENKLESIVQIQVNEDIGLNFSNILRSSLRSDPDVIIVSEIRDELTAEIAIRASLTGHLVLATLHTNDSISTFNRLIDMHIPKYLLLDSILLILSQKLLTSIDNKEIKNRLLISEAIYFDDTIKNIFSKYELKNEILEQLKIQNFKTMEDDLHEKGYNI